jgi:hypothetical protein
MAPLSLFTLIWGWHGVARAETGVKFLQAFASSSDQPAAFMIGHPPGQYEEAALASSLMQEKHAGHSVSGSVRQNKNLHSQQRQASLNSGTENFPQKELFSAN